MTNFHIVHKDDNFHANHDVDSRMLCLCASFPDYRIIDYVWINRGVYITRDQEKAEPTCETCILIAFTNPELIYNEDI